MDYARSSGPFFIAEVLKCISEVLSSHITGRQWLQIDIHRGERGAFYSIIRLKEKIVYLPQVLPDALA